MTTQNDTPEPVAWANADDDGIYAVGLSEAHAHYVLERAANGNYSHRNPRIVPLYREPQPTLTDEEREVIACAAASYSDNDDDEDCARVARTLRGLLERTGGRNG
jgi:hypothetical protein